MHDSDDVYVLQLRPQGFLPLRKSERTEARRSPGDEVVSVRDYTQFIRKKMSIW